VRRRWNTEIMKSLLILPFFTSSLFASEFEQDASPTSYDVAQVTYVSASQQDDGNWCFKTSVRHNDEGWEHYADGWQVLDLNGNQLADRLLTHPHVNEQPFTRRLCDIQIPEGTVKVVVRAKCNKHSYGDKTIVVDLNKVEGDGYQVRRLN